MGVGRVPGPANAGDAGGPDVREIVDAMIDGGATLSFDLRADEAGPVLVSTVRWRWQLTARARRSWPLR